jgi:hypothetical protein
MINPKTAEKENFFKKMGTKSINLLLINSPKKSKSPDKKSTIKYSENYLEMIQSDLSKKIKEKKISKLSNCKLNTLMKTEEYDFSIEKLKIYKTSNNTSKLKLESIKNPFKINKKSKEENLIKEFELEEELKMETEEKEEELETVFKKNQNNILDMSVNFIVIIFKFT